MNLSVTELYIFGVCFIVFTALTILLVALITMVLRSHVRLVGLGAEDENIRKEYDNRHKQSKFLNIIGFLINLVVCILLLLAFGASVAINVCERKNCTSAENGVVRVIRSNSMAKAYEKNEYLFKNGLDDEKNNFRLFDLVYTHPIPAEEDLELYDVVVYDIDGIQIIHRIVKIEEPNEKHPKERYFYLQGDNNPYGDPKYATYGQMRGIWYGQKIGQVGSFILFLQSPAGALCVLLMLISVFAVPIVTGKLEKIRKERYRAITGVDLFEEERLMRNKRPSYAPVGGGGSMSTYYNRPGSPYSNPAQSRGNSNFEPYSTNGTSKTHKITVNQLPKPYQSSNNGRAR